MRVYDHSVGTIIRFPIYPYNPLDIKTIRNIVVKAVAAVWKNVCACLAGFYWYKFLRLTAPSVPIPLTLSAQILFQTVQDYIREDINSDQYKSETPAKRFQCGEFHRFGSLQLANERIQTAECLARNSVRTIRYSTMSNTQWNIFY